MSQSTPFDPREFRNEICEFVQIATLGINYFNEMERNARIAQDTEAANQLRNYFLNLRDFLAKWKCVSDLSVTGAITLNPGITESFSADLQDPKFSEPLAAVEVLTACDGKTVFSQSIHDTLTMHNPKPRTAINGEERSMREDCDAGEKIWRDDIKRLYEKYVSNKSRASTSER